jgi:hypothetical protein
LVTLLAFLPSTHIHVFDFNYLSWVGNK